MDQGRTVAGGLTEVGVEQQQSAGLRTLVALLDHPETINRGFHGGRLAPVAGMGDHDRTCAGRMLRRTVATPVIANDHDLDPRKICCCGYSCDNSLLLV